MRLRPLLVTGAALLAWGSPRAARAEGAALDRLEVSERGSRFFAADSLELDSRLSVTTGVVASYQHALRVFGTFAESSRTALVSDQLALHPGVALVMAPGARFALDVPVVFENGRDENLAGGFYPAPDSPVLGDVRLAFDLKLLGPEKENADGVVLAGGVTAWLPTGSRADYVSDDYTRVGVRAASVARFGSFIGAARLGLTYRRDDLAPFGGVELGSEMSGVVALGWHSKSLTVGPEIHGVTILRNDVFGHRSTPIEGLVGAHGSLGTFTVGGGVGTALLRGMGSAGFRALVSIEWSPTTVSTSSDRDGDGVPDKDDACPDVQGTRTGPVESLGCPEPPRDRDRDGVVDGEDACPDLAGVRTRDAMTNGCPDSDRDGIPDPVDACPTVSGERSAIPRFNGCPPDSDGDEVPDVFDACPDQPGVPTTDPATNGCPPAAPPPPDRDKDGVADENDACPDEPGNPSEDAATNGCPLVRRDGDKIVLLHPIVFELTRPVVASSAEPTITALAAWLFEHPEIARVRIEAHADNRSRLTQDQAQAVVERLVANGISRKRLDARGMGGTKGAKWRVELRILAK